MSTQISTKLIMGCSAVATLFLLALILFPPRGGDSTRSKEFTEPLVLKESQPIQGSLLLPGSRQTISALVEYNVGPKGLPATLSCILLHIIPGEPKPKTLQVSEAHVATPTGLVECKQIQRMPDTGKVVHVASLRNGEEPDSTATVFVEYALGVPSASPTVSATPQGNPESGRQF